MMATHPKHQPRFLPTLTEVVHARQENANSGANGTDSAANASAQGQAVSALELSVSRIMLRLEAPLQARLKLAVGALIHGQIEQLMPMIQLEIEAAVREAVMEGVTNELVRARNDSG